MTWIRKAAKKRTRPDWLGFMGDFPAGPWHWWNNCFPYRQMLNERLQRQDRSDTLPIEGEFCQQCSRKDRSPRKREAM